MKWNTGKENISRFLLQVNLDLGKKYLEIIFDFKI